MKKVKLLLLLTLQLYAGCSIEKAGQKLGDGFSLSSRQLASNALTGVQDKLKDSVFRKDLQLLLDSLIYQAGLSATRSSMTLRDSLLDEKWFSFTDQLVESATGLHTRNNVASIRDELLGDNTRMKLRAIIQSSISSSGTELQSLRNELLGNNTRLLVGELRDDLLGYKTNLAVRAIVDSAVVTLAARVRSNVKGAVEDNAPFLERYADKLLMVLAAVAAVIILLIWRSRQRYLKVLSVLTSQIHNIPDEKAYDELTLRIKNAALANNVEKDLKKFLEENEIGGKEEWLKTKKKSQTRL